MDLPEVDIPETEQHGTKTSLDRILETRNLPSKATRLAILRSLAERIDADFASGGMSGDLTPENVLVSGDLSGVDLTAGLKGTGVRFIPEEELGADGRIPEAARYLPPERILGTGIDIRSHEFSLAVMAFEFMCGRKPFDAPDLSQLFYRVCTDAPLRAHELNHEINEEASAVLSRALSKEPAKRFVNCTAFIEALNAALNHGGDWVGSVSPPEAVSKTANFERQAVPDAGAYGLSTTRLRRRYAEGESSEEEALLQKGSRTKKLGLIVALCLAALGLSVFLLRYKPTPELPVQVLDTNSGLTTPPPTEDRPTHVKKATKPFVRAAAPARKTVVPQEPLTSDVEILTDPPSAQVLIDGNAGTGCASPCTLSLPSGRHTLSAELTGFTRAQRIFTVPQEKSLFISLSKRMGTLVVTSVPSGLALSIDGRDYGLTPATVHLPPGEHRMVLINGGLRHSDLVNVEADAIQAKAIHW